MKLLTDMSLKVYCKAYSCYKYYKNGASAALPFVFAGAWIKAGVLYLYLQILLNNSTY